MEEESSEDPERYHARQRFRVKMARLSRHVQKQSDPTTAVDMSNVPPHLANKYMS